MDYLRDKPKPVNPKLNTNIIFNLFFTYVKDIIIKGARKELTKSDLYEVLPSFKGKKLADRLEEEWEKLVLSKKKSMMRLLWRVYKKEFLLIVFSLIIPITTGVLQQRAMKNFIVYFTTPNISKTEGLIQGFFLTLFLFIESIYTSNFFYVVVIFCLKMRSGFIALIYRKVLTMETVSAGRIIDLVTKDVNEFEFSVLLLFLTIRDFTICLMICYVLYTEIGWLSLILVLVLLLIISPDCKFILKVGRSLSQENYQHIRKCKVVVLFLVLILVSLIHWAKSVKLKSLKWSDERYQHTKEVLNSIRLLKIYLWTDKFNEKICAARKKEVIFANKLNILKGVKRIFAESIIKSVWYILLVCSIYFGSQLNAGSLFLILNSVNALKKATRLSVPLIFQEIACLIAVYTRIGDFLRSSRTADNDDYNDIMELPKIKFSDVTFGNLQKLNFELPFGLTSITGPVGSGKSTLLKVMAREHPVMGDLTICGSISYASQEPWLFPSTIKQNILFGSEYNEKRYFEVLQVCGLLYDLEKLKEGDKTLVLDRGVNLSKGQQVRVNLARAVYKNSDIYLVDDCLSHLDVLVADSIFKECILKFLRDKIVVMASQNSKYITASNYIINLKDGEAECQSNSCEKYSEKPDRCDVNTKLSLDHERKIYEEHKFQGKVRFSTYKRFVLFGELPIFFLTILIRVTVQFLKGTTNKLESKWINAEQTIFTNSTNTLVLGAVETRDKMIYLFPILLVSSAMVNFLMTKSFWTFCAKVSINLHRQLLEKITHATMEFFDKFLIGTILNRFSEDLLYIDDIIPTNCSHMLNDVVELLGIIFVIATVNTFFLVPSILLSSILLIVRMIYLRSARALRRLEFTLRSPFIGHLSATLDGLVTIRASKTQAVLCDEFERRLDTYTSCCYMWHSAGAAFDLIVEIFGVFFVCFIVVFFLFFGHGSTGGDIGLVLSQGFFFMNVQIGLYNAWTFLENNMTIVERTLKYMKHKQELNDGTAIEEWPRNGEIKYENVSFSYNEDVIIHSNLNFTIKPKEKVAIVGRTGSGKTSMIASFLRLYDFKGKISVDGVDITTLPLNFFRSRVSVIPQDPILFTASLRDNIDPLGKHTDDEIWTTLRTVKLSSLFQSLNERIRSDSKLSVGQKQLICLCRALNRRNKIVVIDELTANVDEEVEAMVYEIIEEHFRESTVIMITHKLQHILNYNKVLVLDKGQVVEFGAPDTLLEDKNGIFYKMYTSI